MLIGFGWLLRSCGVYVEDDDVEELKVVLQEAARLSALTALVRSSSASVSGEARCE